MPDFRDIFKHLDPNTKIRILEKPELKPTYFLMDEFGKQKMSYLRDWKHPPERLVIKDYKDTTPDYVPGTKSATINAMLPYSPPRFDAQNLARIHRKRSNQSAAYHRRVQKKWRKRGLMEVRTVELMQPVVLRLPVRVLHQIARAAVDEKHRGVKVRGPDLDLDLEALNIWVDNTRTNLEN